ncbi:Cyclin-dependent kinases regulatory subunit, partial [Fragariocoptes setiger]
MSQSSKQILYSDRYYDDKYEYRHVQLPPEIAKLVPRSHLMTEAEWRAIGVQQSPGWIHYMIHEPEPHVLLFRRPISASTKPPTQEEQIKAEMEAME